MVRGREPLDLFGDREASAWGEGVREGREVGMVGNRRKDMCGYRQPPHWAHMCREGWLMTM